MNATLFNTTRFQSDHFSFYVKKLRQESWYYSSTKRRTRYCVVRWRVTGATCRVVLCSVCHRYQYRAISAWSSVPRTSTMTLVSLHVQTSGRGSALILNRFHLSLQPYLHRTKANRSTNQPKTSNASKHCVALPPSCLPGSWPRFLYSDSLSGCPEGGSNFIVLHSDWFTVFGEEGGLTNFDNFLIVLHMFYRANLRDFFQK